MHAHGSHCDGFGTSTSHCNTALGVEWYQKENVCGPLTYPAPTSLHRSVVASALGIPALLPFLKAVCLSKKSWQARHTGIKIVQQIAILMGCAVLPHLKALVDIIKHGLKDENQKARAYTPTMPTVHCVVHTSNYAASAMICLQCAWSGMRVCASHCGRC